MLDVFLVVPGGFKTRLSRPYSPFLHCSLFQVVALGYCQTTVNLHCPDFLMLLLVCWTWGRRPGLFSGWFKVSSNSISVLSRTTRERRWASKACLSGSKARVSCCRLLKSIGFLLLLALFCAGSVVFPADGCTSNDCRQCFPPCV